MKIHANKRYNTIAFYAVMVIAVNVLLVVAVFRFSTIMSVLSKIFSVLSPITWGLVIAFLMNPIMKSFEKLFKNRVVKDPSKKKLTRACSVSVSAIVFLGIVIGVIAIVMPELINSVNDIFNNSSTIVNNIQKWINKLFSNYLSVEKFATDQLKSFTKDMGAVINKVQPMLENIVSGAWGVVTSLKNFVLGFIVSIYMLCSKEKLMAQTKKILIAITKKTTYNKIYSFLSQANKVFSGFLIGKIIDSLIIGVMCFIGLTIMDMPYNIMISVIVGVTNIIPFFGPIIGAIPSTLLMLFVAPGKTIFLLIFIVVLQQFDGNILGPKILGDSTGLPGFWVLVALFICGGLFGFVGMVIAVPLFALIYSFTRTAVEGKLRKKRMPVGTDYYMENGSDVYRTPARKRPLTEEQLEAINIPSAEEVNEAFVDEEEDSMTDSDDSDYSEDIDDDGEEPAVESDEELSNDSSDEDEI